jgi:transposase
VIGADGYALLDALCQDASARHLLELPAVEILRRIWVQHYYRCTEPGAEDIRWRDTADQPSSAQRMQSPYDVEARYSSKRSTNWVGYKVHLTETCDEGYPDLITQVSTTLATTSDFIMGAPIEHDLAERDLLPGPHVLDSGYVVAALLVNAPRDHHMDVVGPALSSSSRQGREGQGYDVHSFAIDGEAQQAYCPQGHCSVKWTPGTVQRGMP